MKDTKEQDGGVELGSPNFLRPTGAKMEIKLKKEIRKYWIYTSKNMLTFPLSWDDVETVKWIKGLSWWGSTKDFFLYFILLISLFFTCPLSDASPQPCSILLSCWRHYNFLSALWSVPLFQELFLTSLRSNPESNSVALDKCPPAYQVSYEGFFWSLLLP